MMKPIIQRESGTALYQQVYLALYEMLVRGHFPLDQPLPTEAELCKIFGVSRITLRRAMTALVEKGLLERTPGRGTFAKPVGFLQLGRQPITLGDQLARIATETNVQLLSFDYERPDGRLRDLLRLASGELVQRSRRLRLRGEVPAMLLTSFVPASLGRTYTAEDLSTTPLYKCLEKAGVSIARIVQEFTAIEADPGSAGLLGVSIGSALGLLHRISFDADARPVQYIETSFVPGRVRFRIESIASNDPDTDTDAGQYVYADSAS